MADKLFGHEGDKAPDSKKGDKHRQQIIVGASIVLVLLAYLTYRRMKSGQGGGTVSPTSTAPIPAMPVQTGTNIPSGTAAQQTTTPYAAPTDTTGGGNIPVTSGTPTQGAPSSTVPPVTPAPQTSPSTAPTSTATTGQAQSVTPTPHPAGSPALTAPLAAPHPTGAPLMPGGAGFTPINSQAHPATSRTA
jgi:serine/threonine-protein kinase